MPDCPLHLRISLLFPLCRFLSDLKYPELHSLCSEILNDCYRIDLVLSYPPYLLAIAAIYIACSFQGKEYRNWMAGLNVDREKVSSSKCMHARVGGR